MVNHAGDPVSVHTERGIVDVYDLENILAISVLVGDRVYEIDVMDNKVVMSVKYPDGDLAKLLLDEPIIEANP